MDADTQPTEVTHPPTHRPPRGLGNYLRVARAYVVTFRVVLSYLGLKLWARFGSPSLLAEVTNRKHSRNARRIAVAIGRLQGLFIKVGQLFSIMSNFLPREFRAQLEGLQDKVPPRPFEDVEARFREEFDDRTPDEVFAYFEREPVASASIGQVHMARTRDGIKVAVKVQYPDIEEMVRIDLLALKHIVRIISWFIPAQGLDGVYNEIRAMIAQELDFRREAENIRRIAANFAGSKEVGFPRVLDEYSTGRILCTEWIDAPKIGDQARLEALGVDRRKVARAVVQAYCKQIFSDGVYHADPHPGNLLVRADGSIVFIDFGAVAEVSPQMRQGIAKLIQAALARDTPALIQAMKQMGFIARGVDTRIFDRVVDTLYGKFQENIRFESFSLKEVKFDPQRGLEHLADLRRMDLSLHDLAEHFHVPREWIMLERTLLLLMGLCTDLDPELNPMEVIRPYLQEFVFGKDEDWSAYVLSAGKELLLSAVALPGEMKKAINRALLGEMEVRVRGLDDHARAIYVAGHQMIYAAAALTAACFWLVLDGRGQAVAARWAAWTAGGIGAWLGLSFLANRHCGRRRRR